MILKFSSDNAWSTVTDIKEITSKESWELINTAKPRGLFISKTKDTFCGIDNSTGECWVEEFITVDLCIKWLRNEVQMDELEYNSEGVLEWLKK